MQTLAQYGPLLGWGRPVAEDQSKDPQAASFAVHTLEDDETIARLATGVKRFDLPAGHNFIELLEEVARLANQGVADDAVQMLARIYENRRQYERAAAYWEKYEQYNRKHARRQIEQIRDTGAPAPEYRISIPKCQSGVSGSISHKSTAAAR